MENLKTTIEAAWNNRDSLATNDQEIVQAIITTLTKLDQGLIRVAIKSGNAWVCHEWVKKAILLSFKFGENKLFHNGPATDDNIESAWFDKIPIKTQGWNHDRFYNAGFRAVPGAIIRHSAFVAPNVVLMPSFINMGVYIDEGTMVDTWVTIGSCAQIGKNCHISGGVGIGGVLEPLQANPVIIEDNCFIGARSEIAEGVVVEEGAVISMGVFLGASTKIVNRETGDISYGRVPAYSVVVPGTFPGKTPDSPSLACAVIVKQVDARTRAKTAINDLLRA